MTEGLFALEQSLVAKALPAARGERPPSALQQQIEVVQGRRRAQPSNSLRELEARILSKGLTWMSAARDSARQPAPNSALNSAPNSRRETQHQTQRLDHGQAPPRAVPADPSQWAPDATSAEYDLEPTWATEQRYAPELSAPDTGRFQVEAFGEPLAPDALLQSAPAVSASPAAAPSVAAAPGAGSWQATAVAEPPTTTASSPSKYPDDEDWLTARESAPQKISASSRDALDSSTALAAHDFEQDLAAILGHAPSVPASSEATPALTAPAAESAGTPSSPTASDDIAPGHPSHAIFDQMGLGMQYANSFDLGAVQLQRRFDDFERAFERDFERDSDGAPPPSRLSASNDKNTAAPSPYLDPQTRAAALTLDEIDLVAELAEISAERPRPENDSPGRASADSNRAHDAPEPIQQTTGDDDEQPIG